MKQPNTKQQQQQQKPIKNKTKKTKADLFFCFYNIDDFLNSYFCK